MCVICVLCLVVVHCHRVKPICSLNNNNNFTNFIQNVAKCVEKQWVLIWLAVRRDWAYEGLQCARAPAVDWPGNGDRLCIRTCCGSVDGSNRRLAGSRLAENNCNARKKFREALLNKHLSWKRRRLTTGRLFLADPPIGRINITFYQRVLLYRHTVFYSFIQHH
jgi:hypothetical protein